MSLNNIIQKFKKFWYIILIFIICGSYVSISQIGKETFKTNIILGLSPAGEVNIDNDNTSAQLLSESSNFLFNLMQTKTVEGKILDKTGLNANIIDDRQTFYKINNLSGGYVSINYDTDKKETAQNFVNGVREVYQEDVVRIWNEQKNDQFKSTVIDDVTFSIIKIDNNSTQAIIPLLISIILAIIVVLILPLKSSNKK